MHANYLFDYSLYVLVQVDLVGGYYDAGDNLKFGLPMAFTTTLLAWSVIEFGSSMQDQIDNARAAIRWSTDYLLKAATTTPDTLYVQVSGRSEHVLGARLHILLVKNLFLNILNICRLESLTWITGVGKGRRTWTLRATCIRSRLKIRVLMLQPRRQLHWLLPH